MCKEGCKHWLVSSEIKDGYTTQTCKDCGKQVSIPGTMFGVIEYMQENKHKYATRIEYINKYYSRVI